MMKKILSMVCSFGLVLGMCGLANATCPTYQSNAITAQNSANSKASGNIATDDSATGNYDVAALYVADLPATIMLGTWTCQNQGDVDAYNAASAKYSIGADQYNMYHPLAVSAISGYNSGIAAGSSQMSACYMSWMGNPNYSGFLTPTATFLGVASNAQADAYLSCTGLTGGCIAMEAQGASIAVKNGNIMWQIWRKYNPCGK